MSAALGGMYANTEDEHDDLVEEAVGVADRLLAERDKRFPVEAAPEPFERREWALQIRRDERFSIAAMARELAEAADYPKTPLVSAGMALRNFASHLESEQP